MRFQQHVAAVRRVFFFIDYPTEEDLDGAETLTDLGHGIAFDDVSYRYPDGRAALKNVNLALHPGELVAFVGPTGAGKTSLAYLIPAFLRTTQGAQGPAGPQGPAGNDGADGAQGPAGPQGPAGNDGADGAQGPAGPQGPAGNDGADGAQGPAGPQGPAGNDGADGAEGPQGPAGADGLNGAQGPAGTDGVDGIDGADGADGTSCSVVQGVGSATINCDDSTTATVFDGADGAGGGAGGNRNMVMGIQQFFPGPGPVTGRSVDINKEDAGSLIRVTYTESFLDFGPGQPCVYEVLANGVSCPVLPLRYTNKITGGNVHQSTVVGYCNLAGSTGVQTISVTALSSCAVGASAPFMLEVEEVVLNSGI